MITLLDVVQICLRLVLHALLQLPDEKISMFTRPFSNATDKANSRNSYLTSLNILRYFVRIACMNININELFTIQSNLIIQIDD